MAYINSSQQTVGQKNMNPLNNNGTVKAFLIGTVVVLAIGGAWYTYRYYAGGKEASAQKVLVNCLAQFDKAEQDKNADWASLQAIASVAYNQQKNTNAAPYLLALEAEALTHLDRKDEALECLNKAIAALSTSSPFYYLYKTKRALIKIDGEQASVEQGLQELKELAQDTKNKNNDQAQFYLGLYHWSRNDLDQARQAWQPLVNMNLQGEGASPWAVRAQEKLQLLV